MIWVLITVFPAFNLRSQNTYITITPTLCKLCINYSPVQSFSTRLVRFSLKKKDWTVLRSGPELFGDCDTVRSQNSGLDCLQISPVQSGPQSHGPVRPVYQRSRGFSLGLYDETGPVSYPDDQRVHYRRSTCS